MGSRFWRRLALAGGIAAGLAIFWPALSLVARGQLLGGALAFAGTCLLLALIYRQNR